MQTFVIEHVPRDQEESELTQAGDSEVQLLQTLSIFLALGERIPAIYRNGQPFGHDEFLAVVATAAHALAALRLATALDITVENAQELMKICSQ